MGFQVSLTDTTRPSDIALRSIDHKHFKLVTGFAYIPKEGDGILVPPHDPDDPRSRTDLASVPPLLWGLLASYGRQLRAALMHDHLCDLVNAKADAGDREVAAEDRRRADDLFREAMRDKGDGSKEAMKRRVGWFRSWLFWAGVSFGRYWKFAKLKAAVLTLQVLTGIIAVYVAADLLPHRVLAPLLPEEWETRQLTCLALFAAFALLATFWRGGRIVAVIGLIVGPFLVPVLLVTLLAQVILALPDAAIWLVRKSTEPAPNFGTALPTPEGEPQLTRTPRHPEHVSTGSRVGGPGKDEQQI